ncbi:MAG: helix-turn-helix domain-containing protein [Bacilli bacterium]|nr:helix-turn-helix domain-containing protein [Bacilli bacterium]MBR2711479.1 helix-turn-helix domain-containing protein [Bacilli bacterium]
MTFNDKIDQFMEKNNIKDLKTLAVKSDIPYTTLRDFYNKKSADNSRLSTIRKLSKFMNCTLDYLAFDNGEIINISDKIIKIPVLGVIKAGTPIEAQEDIIEYVDIPEDWTKGNKKYYGLKIQGDSMYPKYVENDIVIFEQTEDYIKANKKDCAVMVNGDDATFKNVTITESGITLIPLNINNSDGYQPTFYDKEQIKNKPVKIIGIAREKRTRL